MQTRDELFRTAQRQVAARRQRAVMRAEENRRGAYAAHPELAQADEVRVRAGLDLTRAAAKGEDLTAARTLLTQAEQALQQLTEQAGYTAADFLPAYTCPDCQDTGSVNGRPCHCVRELVRCLRREEINQASPLQLCGFETFDLTRYSTDTDAEAGAPLQEYMGKIYRYCKQYAAGFTPHSPSLMFTGAAGLGKTHMALAIADTVLERGYDVLYTSSAALVAQLSREHFDHDSDAAWLTACKEADLLILDDLGTEYVNALTISVLYELINARMLCARPTVYTSNITEPQVFEARYTEKVASRILGSCKEFRFFGVDQRRPQAAKNAQKPPRSRRQKSREKTPADP